MDMLSAKTGSLIGKYTGVIFILVASIFKGFKLFGFDLGISEIITIGIAIAALFSTVDINILVDKLVKK